MNENQRHVTNYPYYLQQKYSPPLLIHSSVRIKLK